MKNQFKPGDLALIIHSKIPQNTGKVVELVRATHDEVIEVASGRKVRNPDRLRCWEIVADEILVSVKGCVQERPEQSAAIAERHLMPLRGDFQSECRKESEAST